MTDDVRLARQHANDTEAIEASFRRENLRPTTWSNGPGDTYGWHRHEYDKVLYCVRGTITFHASDSDFELTAGDRLEIDAGTDHAATVGPEGVECMEAAR